MLKEVRDQVLHVVVSLAGLVALAFTQSWWAFVLAGFWFAFVREDTQHRPDEGWLWPLYGWKRWIDIGFGTLGGLTAWFFTFV